MAPVPSRAFAARVLLFLAFACLAPPPAARALRIANYNIMLYPSVNVSGRNPYFRQVLSPLGADVVVVQEIQSQAGVDSFLNNVLNVLEPGQWASAPFINGPDSDNELFYKPSKVTLLGSWAWLPPDNLRNVNVYRLKPVGYNAIPEFRIYSLHLKAGDTGTDEARRLTDAISIRDSTNAVPAGTHLIVTGDFNTYRSSDQAFQKLLESQADNDGRLYDPLNAVGEWQDNIAFASIHTQCPSTSSYRPSGSYSGGGLDDRFDMFLPTYNMNDGQGLELLVSTYRPIGNDGQHMNKSVTDSPIAPADTAYARALWWASDHLPVRVDIQLPAQLGPVSPIAFGTVIVGATATQDLSITNSATPPADALDYSFSAPADFSAPAGSFSLPAGDPAAIHAIGMSTASAGIKSGDLGITSDDPDHPTMLVALSGTVLRHAVPSLDSLAAVATDTLDFGTHAAGEFQPMDFRVHDLGYDALQARLGLGGAGMSDGVHFEFSPGYTGGVLAGVGRTNTLVFNDGLAVEDSTYESTVSIATSDGESYPGATDLSWLTLLLRAKKSSGAVSVPGEAPPTSTRLYPPFPNPLTAGSNVRMDLAQGAQASLEVFDLSGRRVATLARGWLEPGRYSFAWSGRGESGAALGSGLYFLRLSAPGLRTETARLMIVR